MSIIKNWLQAFLKALALGHRTMHSLAAAALIDERWQNSSVTLSKDDTKYETLLMRMSIDLNRPIGAAKVFLA